MLTKNHKLTINDFGIMGCVNYRNNIIWRNGTGFNMWGTFFPSQEELDKAIDGACEVINKSITVKNNNGSMSVDGEGK